MRQRLRKGKPEDGSARDCVCRGCESSSSALSVMTASRRFIRSSPRVSGHVHCWMAILTLCVRTQTLIALRRSQWWKASDARNDMMICSATGFRKLGILNLI